MPRYEYVSEREYKPVKAELTGFIRRAREHVVEDDPELDFEYTWHRCPVELGCPRLASVSIDVVGARGLFTRNRLSIVRI